MRIKRLLALLICVLLLSGCTKTEIPETTAPEATASGAAVDTAEVITRKSPMRSPEELAQLGTGEEGTTGTWYEIFVYTFCDSNGDGIGDIPGVISKLDYLQQLGIDGIWLMPIHPSTTYHKYNVSDYYAIDPSYGTMEDFDRLIAECDARGIRVILDLVINHTADNHPWFRECAQYLFRLPEGQTPSLDECPYLEYYNWIPREEAKGGSWNVLAGSDYAYECPFDHAMPDLNWGSEKVRAEVKSIMEFWLGKGVSGFRLDAAKEYYSGTVEKNVEVLSWITETAKSIDPDCYLVAEVWDGFGTVTEFYRSGIDSLFNFPFADSTGKIIQVLRAAGNPATVNTYATALQKADNAYRGSNEGYTDAPFLSNHDVGRIYGFCAGDEHKIKLAGAMNLMMSGNAFIYYGEELAMPGSGNDPSKRAPMLWNLTGTDGVTNPPRDCSIPEYPFGSLQEQQEDDLSVYNYYRRAIAIRNALTVIREGIPTAESALNQGCVSAVRKTWGDQQCIILMNIQEGEETVDLSNYAQWNLTAYLTTGEDPVTLENTTLTLPAWGVAILTQ